MSTVAISAQTTMLGLRELRANLSDYVSKVKDGRTYTLTEHGKPVARLIPVAGRSAYERLVAQGVIQPGVKSNTVLETPIAINGIVTDLINEQRR
ncbi:MAG: type II toxin-antitoxin system prevent-host-death family antitoxin [Propionibacteriaceae bacterium]|jgi:prevent-host-death family protein|nr:type II toxin-antitoxin system prevent-host-death family antitoxin [Propionibacteriaceae bacterium]